MATASSMRPSGPAVPAGNVTGASWAGMSHATAASREPHMQITPPPGAGSASGTVVARISEGMAQTLMAVFTVPAHCTAYLHQITTTSGKGGDATGLVYMRYYSEDSVDDPLRIAHTFEVQGDGGQYLYDFAFPLSIPERSDIDIRATMRTNNVRITSTMDLLLVENDHNT